MVGPSFPIPNTILEGGSELPTVLLEAVDHRIDEMAPGQILQIISQEPSALTAIRDWCILAGHQLLHTFVDGSVLQFWIQKSGVRCEV